FFGLMQRAAMITMGHPLLEYDPLPHDRDSSFEPAVQGRRGQVEVAPKEVAEEQALPGAHENPTGVKNPIKDLVAKGTILVAVEVPQRIEENHIDEGFQVVLERQILMVPA
ncbi:hypothetical protein DXG01_014057, partial [Tephrocybe rancida]